VRELLATASGPTPAARAGGHGTGDRGPAREARAAAVRSGSTGGGGLRPAAEGGARSADLGRMPRCVP
jgi:hypothetical protein